jgi:GNAT superfamily N-acetyltransferase
MSWRGDADAAVTIEIREVRPEEWATLGDLIVAAYRVVGEDEPGYLEHVRDVAGRAAVCPVLVAVDEAGRVLGGVTYVPGPGTAFSEMEVAGEAGFRMLAVDPAIQGRGVGQRLVEACIERARREGRSGLAILTRPFMGEAQRLYGRLGFRRAPERDWEPAPGVELIAFVLDLAGTQ